MSVAVHQPYGALRMSPRIYVIQLHIPQKKGAAHLQTILAHPRKALRGIDSTLWRKSKRQGFVVQRCSYLCRCMKESVKALREYNYSYLNTNASEYKLAWYRMLLIE